MLAIDEAADDRKHPEPSQPISSAADGPCFHITETESPLLSLAPQLLSAQSSTEQTKLLISDLILV